MVRRPAVADHRWMILNAASGRRGWDVGLARADCARQGLPEHRLPAAALAGGQRRARHRVVPFLRRRAASCPGPSCIRLGSLRPDPETRKNRYAAPLPTTTEQLLGLPPTLIRTAENDVLRDEVEAYARKLDEAGAQMRPTCATTAPSTTSRSSTPCSTFPSTGTAIRHAATELAYHLP
jgi:hypothetical protein